MPKELPEEIKIRLVTLCCVFSARYDIPIEGVIEFAMGLSKIMALVPNDEEKESVH